jgi:hypothetical protein
VASSPSGRVGGRGRGSSRQLSCMCHADRSSNERSSNCGKRHDIDSKDYCLSRHHHGVVYWRVIERARPLSFPSLRRVDHRMISASPSLAVRQGTDVKEMLLMLVQHITLTTRVYGLCPPRRRASHSFRRWASSFISGTAHSSVVVVAAACRRCVATKLKKRSSRHGAHVHNTHGWQKPGACIWPQSMRVQRCSRRKAREWRGGGVEGERSKGEGIQGGG